MARRDSPDFVEAIARGLDVIRAFGPGQPAMSLAAVAAAAGLPRPTARRIPCSPWRSWATCASRRRLRLHPARARPRRVHILSAA